MEYFLPKQSLEVFWQLSTTGIAWIHCDEDPHWGNEIDLLSQEVKSLFLIPDGILYTLHLLMTIWPALFMWTNSILQDLLLPVWHLWLRLFVLLCWESIQVSESVTWCQGHFLCALHFWCKGHGSYLECAHSPIAEYVWNQFFLYFRIWTPKCKIKKLSSQCSCKASYHVYV